jgi:anti-sigma factor RsiW
MTAGADHPNDQILQSYGLGKLDDASSDSVSKHLENCDPCQRRVAELSSDEFLGRLRNAQVKPGKSATSSVGRRPRHRRAQAPLAQLFHRRRPTHYHPNWSTTPTMRSSASWAAEEWAWSTSPITN